MVGTPPHAPSSARGGPAAAGAAAVDRALSLLFVLGEAAPEALTLAALARRSGLYKSTVLRLATSLQAAGMVERQADGRFRLGAAVARLGALYQRSVAPAEVLLPPMRDLAAETGESVAFYVLAGAARVCLYRVESRHALRFAVQEGDVLPLDSGSGGRVLAAFAGVEGAEGAAPAAVRAAGYHHSDGERDPQIAGISAPVFGAGGGLVGALTVAGPRSRLTPARAAELLPALLRAATAASAGFGATPATAPPPCPAGGAGGSSR
jgi:DNA-binding IclR family transcriptional regulator